jgi:SAM-dependent methyltransferase
MRTSLSRNAERAPPRVEEARARSAWSSADYAAVGHAMQIVGEELCETVDLCEGARVLDVAVGNGHAALAAARRWCEVTSTDLAPDLSDRAGQRSEAENLGVRFVAGEAEALPFGDQSFDAVLSAFGAMFAVDQERAAAEMIRVCARGGTVGLANWTPDGFVAELFRVIQRHSPQPADATPFLWGTEGRLEELFGLYGDVESTRKRVAFRQRAPAEWVARVRAGYPPLLRTFARLDKTGQRVLTEELLALASRFNRALDGSLVVDADYLEVVVMRR